MDEGGWEIVDDRGNDANIVNLGEFFMDVGITIYPVEFFIVASKEEVNSWMVHEVDVWVDRRAPWTFENVDLPVGKLECYDLVINLLKEADKIWRQGSNT